LREDSIPVEIREELLRVFRNFREHEPPREQFPLGIGDAYVSAGDHLAYFWESEEDFQRGVGFLALGLQGTDCCFLFGHEEANQKVLGLLARMGLPLRELMAARRLRVVGGNPSAEAMLSGLGAAFAQALAEGASVIRLLGNLGWGREGWPAENDILAFEAKVTEVARQFPCIIVCMYDVHAISGRVLLKGGFETHPLTVHGRAVHPNPHFVPVESYLAELQGESGSEPIQ
jgi:hypothetical protein